MTDKTIEQLEAEISSKLDAIVSNGSELNSPITVDATSASYESLVLSGVLLAFGLLISLTMAYLVKQGKEPDALLRTFGTTLIIIAAVFLIVAGYSEKQIAPVIGLLGTVAGYILGKTTKE